MKYSEIFLKAAEYIEIHNNFTCDVIDEMVYWKFCRIDKESLPRKWYAETLGLYSCYGFSLFELHTASDSKNRRVIMLCLAAAIAESEGL